MRSKWYHIYFCIFVLSCVCIGDAYAINYAEALQKSLYFYDAEKSGPGITGGRLTWRGDSELVDMAVPLYEGLPTDDSTMFTNMSAEFIQANIDILDPDGDGTVDVSGGYHDAGDHVKFGLPQTYSSSTMEWALYEFKDAFVRIGEYDHMVELLRWFSDYYLRSTFRNADGEVVAFCYQVGEGSVDHNFWGPPEMFDFELYPRPAYFATAETPASDQAAGAAASLAITYLNSLEDDSTYAETCLDTARALYAFAKKYRGLGYSGGFYGSGFDEDELAWAAIWLHIATGEDAYLEDIISQDAGGQYTGWLGKIIKSEQDDWQNIWVHCWDTKWGGVFAKLAPITDHPRDWEIFRWNLEFWSGVPHQDTGDGNYLAKTPDGFSWLCTWGSARYNAAAQLQGMIYKKYTGSDIFDAWMLDQMNYIMGDNPLGRSYIVGYSDNYAEHPHHRAAHGSSTCSMDNPAEHKHILWGALVGGPGMEDEHVDSTSDYIYNEVAIDYNAGLVGALAGFVTYFGQDHQPLADFPPADPPIKEFMAEAKIEQVNHERSQVTIRVTNEAAFPPRMNVSIMVRYFFTISEIMAFGQDISDVSLQVYYDEGSDAKNGPAVTAGGPLLWDADSGLYYLEFRWPDSGFYGTREYQFALVVGQDSNWESHWDPGNDYSLQELSSEYVEARYIPIYIDGELYAGIEPDGEPDDGSVTGDDDDDDTGDDDDDTGDDDDDDDTGPVGEIPISMPFEQDGPGTFSWVTEGRVSYVNSWNMDKVEVNGKDVTGVWSDSFPAADDGKIHIVYEASVPWAHFEIIGTGGSVTPVDRYQLTTEIRGQGRVVPGSGTYDQGATVTLTATADDGYHFDRWSGDASGTSTRAVLTMDSDKSVVAIFVADEPAPETYYDLSVSVNGSGSVTPVSGSYLDGTTVTLTATAAEGFHFQGWSGDTSGSSRRTTLVMDSDKSVVAIFVADEPSPEIYYDLSLSVDGNGSVTPSGGSYAAGSIVTLTATPDSGYTFDGWTGDVKGSSASITITMNADKAVTVSFSLKASSQCEDVQVVSLPTEVDGPGTFCLFTTNNIAFVNSWVTESVTINGVDFTNTWSNSIPARQDGGYYIHVNAPHSWSHLAVELSGDPEPSGQPTTSDDPGDDDDDDDDDDTPEQPDWLHTRGNRIVDSNGQTVWLTGANWFGFNASERVLHGLWSAHMETVIAQVAQRGINILRVPISTQLLAEWMSGNPPMPVGINYYANPELEDLNTLDIFDRLLALCKTYGVKVMLDVHSAEANNSGHVFTMWYTEDITADMFYDTWEWVAERYKNDDTLVAFDLENEPHGKPNERPRAKWDNTSDPDNWKYVCEQASRRILAINPNVLVLCEGIEIYPMEGANWETVDEKRYHGTWWGGNLRGVADYPIDLGANQDQLVYSPHDYGPSVFPQTWFEGNFTMQSLYEDVWLPNWFFIQEENIAPLLIGEWGGFMDGEDNEKWMILLRDFIGQNHIHHTFWCVNPNSGDTGGLLNDDWATWDEEKYTFLKPALWQTSGGRFVGLDHDVPLGGRGSSTGVSLSQYYSEGGTPPNP